ncbi:MAG: PP2C family protein-serine/threonine phosphatase [Gammaproteobacteria bacterium]
MSLNTGGIADEGLTVFPDFDCGGKRFISASFSAWGARAYNEDRTGWNESGERACWALADGLGGYQGGGRAAELAVESGLDAYAHSPGTDLVQTLEQAIRAADARIHAVQQHESGHAQMRSTLVMLGVSEFRFAWAHTGDSRLYHFRDGQLRWRTRDHSAVQLLVAAGELDETQIAKHPDRSRLVSCLGGENSLLVSVRAGADAPQTGDAFLLCSDGLWEHFTDAALQAWMIRSADQPGQLLESLAREVDVAARPDQDNYSAVFIAVC